MPEQNKPKKSEFKLPYDSHYIGLNFGLFPMGAQDIKVDRISAIEYREDCAVVLVDGIGFELTHEEMAEVEAELKRRMKLHEQAIRQQQLGINAPSMIINMPGQKRG
jgi:hypothetical protein